MRRASLNWWALMMVATVLSGAVTIKPALSQPPTMQWIDAKTGQPVPTVPLSGANFGGGTPAIINPSNPNQASNSKTGQNFVRVPIPAPAPPPAAEPLPPVVPAIIYEGPK